MQTRLFLILALVAASLGLKAIALETQQASAPEDTAKASVTAFLTARNYALEPAAVVEDRFVRARLGDCTMLVGVLSPRGWHNKGLEALAHPGVEIFYVLEGRVYPRFPREAALLAHLKGRIISAVEISSPAPALFGVAADTRCHALTMSWQDAR